MGFLKAAEQAVWSWPLLLLIFGCGLYLNVRLRFLPLRRLPYALRLILEKPKDGGISPFASLCTALSATVGTGNIVGVAGALVLGGAGALFWMNVSAVVCMSVKYAECLLAVRFREKTPDGYRGGPFSYLRQLPGRPGKVLASAFAVCGAAAGLLGVGTFVQVNSVTAGADFYLTHCLPDVFPVISLWGQKYSLLVPLLCVFFTVFASLILRGGADRIAKASSVLVPVMAGLYLLLCLWILVICRAALPGVLGRVFTEAFRPRAVCGGFLGVLQAGVSRGIFSNEAGLGTAPIAAASADSDSPVRQGLVGMTANIFDTVIVCTLTGLAVLCTGADRLGLTGTAVTMQAFAHGLPIPPALSQGAVLLCLTMFAFTTVVGWSYYGTSCLGYLTHGSRRAKSIYLLLYLVTVLFAPFLHAETVWTAANLCNGLMAAPNLLGLLLLGGTVVRETLDETPRLGIK